MSLTIVSSMNQQYAEILSPEALDLTLQLEKKFAERRKALVQQRQQRQVALDQGGSLDFLPETKSIRQADWRVAAIPADIQDRRVEITGPTDRKMLINALNSGAKVFMADFEDAHSPTWQATMEGQINIRDYYANQLSYVSPEGKSYSLGQDPAVLMLRVRGLHMAEKNVLLNGERISASFFDFAVFLTNCQQLARQSNKGLYFYLPKIEHYLEARLWAEVFAFAEKYLAIPAGTFRCTVLIETIPAVFQMDEILYELKDYIAALNAGRWDYIFSFIKRFRKHPDKVLPERAQVGMTTHFLRSYSRLLIQTCHRRGAHAMGGMAAQIPIKNDEAANAIAFEKVRQDKLREVRDGHDGTWVAHPGLVPVALEVFNQYMPQANQIERLLPDASASAADLLQIPPGDITVHGLYINVSAALQYISAWLSGRGAVPIFNLMEDAATAEISRTQLWQWVHLPGVTTNDGEAITLQRIGSLIEQEVAALSVAADELTKQKLQQAAAVLFKVVQQDDFEEFITTPMYELI